LDALSISSEILALGHKVTLVIKRLEVLKDQNPKDLLSNDDIEKMLDGFCEVSIYSQIEGTSFAPQNCLH
jgi:hypothetical protein